MNDSSTGICTNCAQPISTKYCGQCGQPAVLPRVDIHYLQHELLHVLHFEKGIFYTIKELLLHPGRVVREFITTNRSRLVKPIIFIIVTSLIYTLIAHFFHIEDGYVSVQGGKDSAVTKIFTWVQNHYGYSNIIMGVFITLWVKLIFRKYRYNFFEILILLCFVMGMAMLIFSLFTIAEGLWQIDLGQISAVVFIAYASWAIGQFFDKTKLFNYFKALAAYLLGMTTFSVLATGLGLLIDALSKAA